jgi:uncharacterized phage protein (TIGR01671 family)
MREIKFRGKLVSDSRAFNGYKKGSFIYGGIYNEGDKWYIVVHFNVFEVLSETIGQFTGLTDKNGEEIYEGDILQHTIYPHVYYGMGSDDYNIHSGLTCRYEVIYEDLNASYTANRIFVSEDGVMTGQSYKTPIAMGDKYPLSSYDGYTNKVKFEIIGNIHNNPELLTK